MDQVGSRGRELGDPVQEFPLQPAWSARPPDSIYDAFVSKQAHFRSPLRGINYLKGLICITVVGQCLTRKHSGLSVSIQGELWIFS